MIDTTKSISKVTYDGTNMSLATQTKTVTPTTSEQVIVGDDGYNLSSVTVKAVTKDIDTNIQPNNIKQGVTILGVEGNVAPDKPDQSKIVTPTTEEQVVTADNGFELTSVTVKAVTSSIDENIIPENIKEGVDILGVSGTFVGEGGGDSGGQYLVQVIDYDGTVLKSDHLDTGATFTLPDAPTNHSRLVFQTWSSPVTITDNTITVENSDITIGATYKTASGLTEIDITLTKVTGLEVTCKMVGNKNWGDGTTDSETTHTYANYGEYTITCDGTSIPAGSSSSSGMFSSSSSSPNYYCTEIRVGDSVTSIGNYAFRYCYSLSSVIIPNSVTSIGNNAFERCYSLTSVTIPDGVISIGSAAFRFCYSLTSVTIPNSVASIGSFAFRYCHPLTSVTIPNSVASIGIAAFDYCYSLTSVTIPDGVTSIESQVFYWCYSLTSVTIPNSVTSIGDNAFHSCYSIIKYDFTSATSIPTLSNTNAFNNINGICKIYVPDALYDSWIVATNWATYADYIYKVSEMED